MQEQHITGVAVEYGASVSLLRALADELKLPLTQIARLAELAAHGGSAEPIQTIEITAHNALRLIDGYLLAMHVGQRQLDLEPVSVTATLYDVAEDLYQLSKLYETNITITVKGAPGQVMADRRALRAALTGLAHTFITGGLRTKKKEVVLRAQLQTDGITAGVLSNDMPITSEDLQLARTLYGKAGQPAGGLTQNSAVGLYVADNLFAAMESPLKVTRSGRRTGLVATLTPSHQLALL